MQNIFYDIGIIIIIATLFAFIIRLFKQPLIPAYILTGLILGPILGLITDLKTITLLSEIGIAFLLFIVGLEIDLKSLKNVAVISSIGGLIRILLLFTFGFIISMLFGFVYIEALYVGLILAFSSTMIVAKLLSDKNELDTLHGRIIIGMLLMEDFIVILALAVLSNGTLAFLPVFYSLFKAMMLLLFAFFIAKYIFPFMFKISAKSQELLFLMSITACFFFALIASYLNLSIIIGAFIAGVALGNLPYNLEIIGKITPLKDFFATIFFVSLGLELSFKSLTNIIKPLLFFVIFIIILKPFLTMFISSFFGYKKRPSFLTSISLAQISEFSLILVSQGFLLGHVSQDVFSLTVLLAIITIIITSYLINFEYKIYNLLSPFLSIFEKLNQSNLEYEYLPKKTKYEVILCGFNRMGYSIFRTMKKLRKKLFVVDFNPEVIRKLIDMRIPCLYGDISDIEILNRLDFKNAEMVISTIADKHDNLLLIKKVKEKTSKAVIFVTANQPKEALDLYDTGADYVILPHLIGGDHVSLLIEDFKMNIGKLLYAKKHHIKELRRRHEFSKIDKRHR
jgi:Kef-type K+ transport system membrane component KefB